jgi:hypothetical protein
MEIWKHEKNYITKIVCFGILVAFCLLVVM